MAKGDTTAHDRELPDGQRESLSLLASSAAGVEAIPLASGREYVIGRAREADIFLDDGSVSRRHAVLRTDGDLTLEDEGSTNGTRVRGVALRPGQRVQVDVGVVIELGSATLLIQRATVASGQASPSTGGVTRHPPPLVAPARDADAPIVRAPQMRRLYEMLGPIAQSSLNVVILGETGVGKEVLAAELHRRSSRAERRLLCLNCGAFPESVLEGELFGYEKGSFTGAVTARPGLFEAAHGGMVFLDEIGEMPISIQSKLLRVLESGEVLRIGSRQPTIVDVRFIAATHRDLRFLIAGGGFRQDLYFRLNGMSVVVPPLRDRREEVRELAERFLATIAAKDGRRVPALTDDAVRLLEEHSWPGNVRELRNVVERALAFCVGREVTAEDLMRVAPELDSSPSITELPDTTGRMAAIDVTTVMRVPGSAPTLRNIEAMRPDESESLRSQRGAFEKERILAALAKTAGNQKRAAELLGVSRRTLVTKLEHYGVERPRKG
jgi:DNA-binding NtrC family response regulator